MKGKIIVKLISCRFDGGGRIAAGSISPARDRRANNGLFLLSAAHLAPPGPTWPHLLAPVTITDLPSLTFFVISHIEKRLRENMAIEVNAVVGSARLLFVSYSVFVMRIFRS